MRCNNWYIYWNMNISVTFFFCLLKNSWQGKDKYQWKSPALSDITGVAESKYRKYPRLRHHPHLHHITTLDIKQPNLHITFYKTCFFKTNIFMLILKIGRHRMSFIDNSHLSCIFYSMTFSLSWCVATKIDFGKKSSNGMVSFS